jgi:predicted ATPase
MAGERGSGRPRRRPRQSGITSLWAEGFKSLQERQQIDVRPLTILAGVNSSGKSSIIQPLLLMKQTLDAPYDPGPLQLDGANVSVTSVEQVLSRQSRRRQATEFTAGFTLNGRASITLTFGRAETNELRLIRMVVDVPEEESVTLTPSMTSDEVEAVLPDSVKNIFKRIEFPTDFRWRVIRDRCFLKVDYSPPRAPVSPSSGVAGLLPTFSTDEAEREIASIIHLPGLRGNPSRTYRATAVGSTFPGTFEAYTAGVIRFWQANNDLATLQQLRSDVEELGLTWKVEAKQIDDTRVELLVGRLAHPVRGGAKDLVNIADVGFGVSQTLPVIVALLVARPGQLVFLEQPEIHLHPRAQLRFAALVARAATRGVRVVVETHSALLIRGIQTLVARGEMSPSLIKLHWFNRSAASGSSNIVSGELDKGGAFGDWPEDFDEVLLESESAYLDAAELEIVGKS